ncbi:MAG TPA: EamA family transporter, partial [Candidatus Thermoplasmatota archaeon]|nr:EamA family transporter [Candidatus Thermoplasmatota archaeon]
IFLGSIFFLQETVIWENYIGILLILCGIYLVLAVRIFTVPRLDRSFVYIAALIPLDVASALLIKWFLGNTEPIDLAVSIQLMAFLILGVLLLIMRRFTPPAPSYVRPRARSVLVASLLAASAAVLLYTALSDANASKVYPLAGVSIITIFLLTTLFLKEKSYPHRFIGTLIVFLGIYLISL